MLTRPRSDLRPLLKNLPPGKAEIWYKEGDPDAWMFAVEIRAALEGSGWEVGKEVVPVPSSRFNPHDLPMWGLAIFGKNLSDSFSNGPFPISNRDDLEKQAEMFYGGDLRLPWIMQAFDVEVTKRDSGLAENSFRIVVGGRDPRK